MRRAYVALLNSIPLLLWKIYSAGAGFLIKDMANESVILTNIPNSFFKVLEFMIQQVWSNVSQIYHIEGNTSKIKGLIALELGLLLVI